MRTAEEKARHRQEKLEKRAEEKRRKEQSRAIRARELVLPVLRDAVPLLRNPDEEKLVLPFEEETDRLKDALKKSDGDNQDFYVRLAESDTPEEMRDEVLGRALSWRRSGDNLTAAALRSYEAADEVSARFNDLTKARKKSRLPVLGRVVGRAPANAVIDLEEEQGNHFARGLNLYKLLLILYIGSFAGVVVELIWCFLRHGYLESRAGLVYGPFNLLYGVGAAVLTVFLYRYRNRGRWLSFLVGMAVGSAVEYACSFAQETFLGSRSWDYSGMPFNLNGRICLQYSVFWGLLGILWLKNLYPRMAALIIRIPDKWGKILTWALFAFFLFNAVVSLLAVMRWHGRVSGIAPSNAFWRFMDLRFPDARMRRIYANLVWS